MSRWIRTSKPAGAPLTPAPGVILPGVPLASATVVDPRPVGPTDPLAGPAPRLAERRDLATAIVTGRSPEDDEAFDLAGIVEAELVGDAPSEADPIDADPVDADPVDADPVGTAPIGRDGIEADAIDADASDADAIDADVVDAEVVHVDLAEVVDPSDRTGTLVQGPWPAPGSAGWPTVVPSWGAAPSWYGRRPVTATLGFADGTSVHASPEVAELLHQAATRLGA